MKSEKTKDVADKKQPQSGKGTITNDKNTSTHPSGAGRDNSYSEDVEEQEKQMRDFDTEYSDDDNDRMPESKDNQITGKSKK